jgi:hypothetical protein
MSKKAKKKKVGQLKLSECEDIIKRLGGHDACIYLQHVMHRYNELNAQKTFDKK